MWSRCRERDETTRNPRKPAVSSLSKHRDLAESSKPTVSSLSRHRDRTESPKTCSLVPLQAPRPHGIARNQQSRPSPSTETTRNPRKPTVSSLSRHRDRTESTDTDSLVPLPAPRPRGFARNQQSRPTSSTETTRNPRKPAVSSHFKHRDHSESPKTDSLVPLPAPRPLGILGKRQSRPSFSTETTWNPPKSAVSSHFRHRDHADSPEISSLVPPSAPRPHEIHRKPAVSSLLQHRDRTDFPETDSLVPLLTPRPRGFP